MILDEELIREDNGSRIHWRVRQHLPPAALSAFWARATLRLRKSIRQTIAPDVAGFDTDTLIDPQTRKRAATNAGRGSEVEGRMRFRKLRIAWSVACGIACVLLIVLWVRSYWR